MGDVLLTEATTKVARAATSDGAMVRALLYGDYITISYLGNSFASTRCEGSITLPARDAGLLVECLRKLTEAPHA